MSWTAPHTFATGEVVTASTLNTYVSNNLTFLGSTVGASSTTSSSTNNTAYSDLGAAGPAVTITTMTTAFVSIGAAAQNNTGNDVNFVGVAVSGATTLAASDTFSWQGSHATANGLEAGTFGAVISNLTAGSNTFTLKYRVNGGVGTYSNRTVTVVPLTV